ncbi:MAG: hypothetical protein GTN86_04425 [Xanthomonadales bacterium]|nr:hypothetical protein [Xanthomonadales bacterium]NIN74573.1 hypothetical protein [Xanthomonadales bacterium]NIP11615.1 hypothetical protein [Xanthomonadales bacterium]NIQ35167.1 hypothetical protein [Xanthomonadales bacterium]NIT33366.1 hypothetical protein [Xanthomonadales bacterium]
MSGARLAGGHSSAPGRLGTGPRLRDAAANTRKVIELAPEYWIASCHLGRALKLQDLRTDPRYRELIDAFR